MNVLVYRGEGTAEEYGTSQFTVDSSVTKVVINIRTVEVKLNGISGRLTNTTSGQTTSLTESQTTIEEGIWKVEVDDASSYTVEVWVYTNKDTNGATNYGSNEFTVDSSVTKVEII